MEKNSIIIIAVLATAAIALAIGLGVGLGTKEDAPDPEADYLKNLPDEGRFDCYPKNGVEEDVDSNKCKARGCVWRSTSTDKKAPWCFYPLNWGYDVVRDEIVKTSIGWKAKLQRRAEQPSRYKEDINTIQVDVEMQTDSRLRIKFHDSSRSRYEVPLELPPAPTIRAKNPLYDVRYQMKPFKFQVIRKETNTKIFDTSYGGFTFEDQFLQISTVLPSKNLYGFGEHNHRQFRHNLDWKTWAIFTSDTLPVEEWNVYGAHPFYMVVENDGNAHGVLLLNSNAMDIVLQPLPALTYRTVGGIFDFYYFLGPTPENVIMQLTEFIGRPLMPPYWSLGFQLSRWDYGSLDEVERVVGEVYDAGIPHDVQYGDIDIMKDKKDFTYDDVNYAGLPEFIDKIHTRGQRYIPILDHVIKVEEGYPTYDRGLNMSVYVNYSDGFRPIVGVVWPGESVYPDFTNPTTIDWWTGECQRFKKLLDYDALWIDMNEPSNNVMGSVEGCEDNRWNYPPYVPHVRGHDKGYLHEETLCMDAKHHIGKHYDLHSLYGHTMSVATYRALQAVIPDKRPLVITRSQHIGTGRYAQHWLGDNQSKWNNIGWSIIGMLEFSLFGFSYTGADICGFLGDTTAELCIRWHQIGAFYPYCRNHNAKGMRDQHPTAFGEPMTSSVRNVLLERYRLLPYLYTLLHDAHTIGSTVVRPMMHEFSRDNMTLTIDKQFMWGGGLLITPVMTEGATIVTGYFPKAKWYDYFSGAMLISEGNNVTLNAPLDVIPVHIRGGFIIPIQEPANTTEFSRQNPMGVIVALDDNSVARGSLFWDDGESTEYKKGNNLYITFNFNKDHIAFVVENYIESDLYFDDVIIYGITTEPMSITIGSDQLKGTEKYAYDNDLKKITLSNLNLNINENHTIWFTGM